MPVPEYDEEAARATDDWANVRGAPDQLSDVPTLCIFCAQFIPITDIDPVLLIAKPWQYPDRGWLYATHEACMREHAEATGMP